MAEGEDMSNFNKFPLGSVIGHKDSSDWSGPILKMVTVNGTIKVLAQIDHGSSDCLMRESVAKDGGWFIEPGNSTDAIIINSIGSTMHPTKLIYVQLTIDGVRGEVVPLLVVPDDALLYPLMVGRSWMEQRSIGYVRDDRELRFFYLVNSQESTHKEVSFDGVFRSSNQKSVQKRNWLEGKKQNSKTSK